ncbi:MAG: hypothetical protein IJK59_00890 [Firmicutes bacterium]|nr:hypothetical protein [Bacillota bacterium]MBQ6259797.1 hypothetical protein [Bacillota bacterium]MBR0114630.1 hypothetical protein [Bacillota bacterium]MBR0440296.1 hypothetical protein [Bacillota bacterium]
MYLLFLLSSELDKCCKDIELLLIREQFRFYLVVIAPRFISSPFNEGLEPFERFIVFTGFFIAVVIEKRRERQGKSPRLSGKLRISARFKAFGRFIKGTAEQRDDHGIDGSALLFLSEIFETDHNFILVVETS